MIQTRARGALISVNFALSTAEAGITHTGIPIKAIVAASRLARITLALVLVFSDSVRSNSQQEQQQEARASAHTEIMVSHRVQLTFCTIEPWRAHALITPIEVTADAADARRGVTLIDVDLAPVSFETFSTLTVKAITLIDTQSTIQAWDIEALVIVLVTVDTSPPVDACTEVRVVAVRVGVFALRAVLARLYA